MRLRHDFFFDLMQIQAGWQSVCVTRNRNCLTVKNVFSIENKIIVPTWDKIQYNRKKTIYLNCSKRFFSFSKKEYVKLSEKNNISTTFLVPITNPNWFYYEEMPLFEIPRTWAMVATIVTNHLSLHSHIIVGRQKRFPILLRLSVKIPN